MESHLTNRRPSKRRPEIRITLDCLIEQFKVRENTLSRYRQEIGDCAQVSSYAPRSLVGRWAARLVSATCNVGSITPATLIAT
jgi:hypothetical protein